VDKEIGNLLDKLEPEVSKLDYGSIEASLVRYTRRQYEKARKVPGDLVAEIAGVSALAKQAWRKAREDSDFSLFLPHLEKLVTLNMRKAEALGYKDRLYDPLLDQFEPGMTTEQVETIFSELKRGLIPIVKAISDRKVPDHEFLHKEYPENSQWDFGLEVIRDIGFDLKRGRQDISTHPFTSVNSINDVRLTTRIQKNYFSSAFFATLHECGHGLYHQGGDPEVEGTILEGGTSLGMHESQSRMLENLVGRNREFWKYFFPRLKARFPKQLSDVDLESFYRAINRVLPSLIRVEADEVTYNLHIMMRFELELAMLEDRIKLKELPELWNAKTKEYLGIVPDNDRVGVLQDIHWSGWSMGYFPTYCLGNLISAQLFDKLNEDLPELSEQFATGDFKPWLGWLKTHVHQHHRKFTAQELLKRITGKPLSAQHLLQYLRKKYSDIYGTL